MTTIGLYLASAYVVAYVVSRVVLVILEALHLVYHAPDPGTPETIRYIPPTGRGPR